MSDTNDMILRDFLAVDRTKLANQRTLLAMIRTGLYFIIMGLSVISLEILRELRSYSAPIFIVGVVVIVFGFINYKKNDNRIREMYQTNKG